MSNRLCLIAGVVVAAGTAAVDKLNRALFAIMVVMLGLTLVSLVPTISVDNLLEAASDSKLDLIKTSSVLFTSFGFVVVIPSLVTYNEGATHKQLRNMIIGGSCIPLVCYLLWLYAAMGNLSSEQMVTFANVSELIAALGCEPQHDQRCTISIYWPCPTDFVFGSRDGAI